MREFFKQFHKERSILSLFLIVSSIFFTQGLLYTQSHPYQYIPPVEEKVVEVPPEEIAPEVTTEEPAPEEPAVEPIIVVIDPGHGGNDSGVLFHEDGARASEAKSNLKTAKYLKEALEQYDNVKVILTRTKNKYMELKARTNFAAEHNADIFVSLHYNSMEDAGGYASGCSVCVAMANYNETIGKASQELGANIAYELSQMGLKNNGLVMRSSKDTDYPNGRAADYYAMIRNSVLNDIPAVIVEHGFLDNPDDYYAFFSSDKKIRKVAQADARGIARYLRLERKDTKEVLPPLRDYKIKICHMRRHKSAKRYSKVFFKSGN